MYGGRGVYETAVSWECVCVCEKKKEAAVAMYVTQFSAVMQRMQGM